MNTEQYKRWKDFAKRMAQKGWPIKEIMRKEHQAAVIPAVDKFFEWMEGNYVEDIPRIESWDQTETDISVKDCCGHHPCGPCVCDIVSELTEEYNPFYWGGDEDEKAYEEWEDYWGGRIRCCIRSGLDLAAEASMGVVGFTKADMVRMYPKVVPGWIRNKWGKQNKSFHPVSWENIGEKEKLWL